MSQGFFSLFHQSVSDVQHPYIHHGRTWPWENLLIWLKIKPNDNVTFVRWALVMIEKRDRIRIGEVIEEIEWWIEGMLFGCLWRWFCRNSFPAPFLTMLNSMLEILSLRFASRALSFLFSLIIIILNGSAISNRTRSKFASTREANKRVFNENFRVCSEPTKRSKRNWLTNSKLH